jgi:ribosomal protein L37E
MQWRVAKEFRDAGGIAWLRRELAGTDWNELDWITVRRTRGRLRETKAGIRYCPLDGVCRLVWGTATYRINTRISAYCGFPKSVRSGQTVRDESEALVWLIAHEVAHYLVDTDQLAGPNSEAVCDVYADAKLAKYREEYRGHHAPDLAPDYEEDA